MTDRAAYGLGVESDEQLKRMLVFAAMIAPRHHPDSKSDDEYYSYLQDRSSMFVSFVSTSETTVCSQDVR